MPEKQRSAFLNPLLLATLGDMGGNKMKAVAKSGYGPFRLESMEVPKPVCGDNDIILKVKAAGICGSDMPLLYGPDEAKYKGYTYPMVIGHEFAGEVCEVGRNVADWTVGDLSLIHI